jgi:hypothetical protein
MNLLKTLFVALLVFLALGVGSQVARAQFPNKEDIGNIDFFQNANTVGAPDASVRIANPGESSNGAVNDGDDLCALIYIFDTRQQMSQCCGCSVTNNGLMILSVNNNLTSNPLLGAKLHAGLIEIVSTSNATPCDPTTLDPNGANGAPGTPERGLRAWASHVDNKVGTAYPVSTGESQLTHPSDGELTDLAEDCTVLRELGSGAGVCTCPPGH